MYKFNFGGKSVIKGMYKIGIDSQSRALAVIVEFLLGFRLLVVNVNITMVMIMWTLSLKF